MMDVVNVRNLIVCILSQRGQGVTGSAPPYSPSPRVVYKFPPDSVLQKLHTECIMMNNGLSLGPTWSPTLPSLISTSC